MLKFKERQIALALFQIRFQDFQVLGLQYLIKSRLACKGQRIGGANQPIGLIGNLFN